MDGNGRGTYTVSLPAAAAVGQLVTATATNTATNDTSEFSAAVAVSGGPVPALGTNYAGLDLNDSRGAGGRVPDEYPTRNLPRRGAGEECRGRAAPGPVV
jgi:hypothetical protein